MASAPKILVAEDADDLRDAIVLVLVEQGYRVQAARDGHEATILFPEFNPDLVVLDMRMPKMSGPETCAMIRQTSKVPVIMFTSSNDSAEVQDAIIKGASDFVLKSTGVVELTDRIAFHLGNIKADDASNNVVKTKTVSAAPIKQPATTTLIIDSDAEARSVIKAVLTRLNQGVEEATSATEAIALYKKVDPDIVISEWKLPDMDGFKMLTELKGTKKSKDLIRMMMSSRLSPEAQRKAHFLGIKNFLIKPLTASKVELMVADCVRTAIRNKKIKARKAA